MKVRTKAVVEEAHMPTQHFVLLAAALLLLEAGLVVDRRTTMVRTSRLSLDLARCTAVSLAEGEVRICRV